MNFLSRKLRTKETERIEDRVIHREIEITVQREWLSVPFHAPTPADSTGVRNACPTCGQPLPCSIVAHRPELPTLPKLLEDPNVDPNL